MNKIGLQRGDEAYVSVRINKTSVADLVITAISPIEVSADLFVDPDADMVAVYEALKSAFGAVDYALKKPTLRALLEERIRELKQESEERWGDNPPAPPSDDFPF